MLRSKDSYVHMGMGWVDMLNIFISCEVEYDSFTEHYFTPPYQDLTLIVFMTSQLTPLIGTISHSLQDQSCALFS